MVIQNGLENSITSTSPGLSKVKNKTLYGIGSSKLQTITLTSDHGDYLLDHSLVYKG